MGFFDVIRAEFVKAGGGNSKGIVSFLDAAMVINATNVSDYYATEVDTAEEYNKHLGSMMPPADACWIEFRSPKMYRIHGSRVAWPYFGFTNVGCQTRLIPLSTPGPVAYRVDVSFFYGFRDDFLMTPPGDEWWRYPKLEGFLELNVDGETVSHQFKTETQFRLYADMWEMLEWNHAIGTDVLQLALSFMNCRNVYFDDVKPPTPVQGKVAQRKGLPKPRAQHEYRVIMLEPLKTTARRLQHPEETADRPREGSAEWRVRQHIVRGGFATYTAEKPLLGKPWGVGKFWRPRHMSGRLVEGEITSEYAIDLAPLYPAPGSTPPTTRKQHRSQPIALTRRARVEALRQQQRSGQKHPNRNR